MKLLHDPTGIRHQAFQTMLDLLVPRQLCCCPALAQGQSPVLPTSARTPWTSITRPKGTPRTSQPLVSPPTHSVASRVVRVIGQSPQITVRAHFSWAANPGGFWWWGQHLGDFSNSLQAKPMPSGVYRGVSCGEMVASSQQFENITTWC